MNSIDLKTLISYLEYGTKLHISIVFLGDFGNSKMELPFEKVIHSKEYCQEMKSTAKGFKRCFACRNLAIKKAQKTKEAFGGKCINGVYEYVYPVKLSGEVVAVIFIGNIFTSEIKTENTDVFEKNFSENNCKDLSLIIENHIALLYSEYKSTKTDYNPLIVNIKNYLDDCLTCDVSVKEIANIFSYSEKYLGRLFKKEFGETIKGYISRKRIEKATSLLEDYSLNITDISLMCGFNNVTYFNKIFKKYEGITPSEYRR